MNGLGKSLIEAGYAALLEDAIAKGIAERCGGMIRVHGTYFHPTVAARLITTIAGDWGKS